MDVGVFGGGVEVQVRQAVDYRVEQHLRLQSRQVHARAPVRSVPERDVLLGVAEDVEGVGVGVPPGIAVRRAERDRDDRARGNADAAQFGSVREVAARVLRDFRVAQIVATSADSVVIADPPWLYAESEGSGGLWLWNPEAARRPRR